MKSSGKHSAVNKLALLVAVRTSQMSHLAEPILWFEVKVPLKIHTLFSWIGKLSCTEDSKRHPSLQT